MGLFSTDCAYCGESGAKQNCGQCGMDFHAKCARQRGDLQTKSESGGLLSSGTTHYRWACPNCGRRSTGSV